MPISPTYPGIYIEELPSSSHTITAAPTSITVFIGYSHPFKTLLPNTTVEVFSQTDYERNLGGYFNTPSRFPDSNFSSLAQAVNQFFLNGGSIAYIVGIPLTSYKTNDTTKKVDSSPIDLNAKTLTVGGVDFTAREITGDSSVEADKLLVMNIQVTNLSASNDIADIKVTYGSQAEVFRNVNLKTGDDNFIEKRIGTAKNPVSSLIYVSPTNDFTKIKAFKLDNKAFDPTFIVPDGSTLKLFDPQNFISVFKQDNPLDKLSIFNLMVLPGVTDFSVLSQALAFCERKRAFVIMDPPLDKIADQGGASYIGDYMTDTAPKSINGALYFPYLKATDPLTNQAVNLPPSGFVAGIFSKTDQNRGVWKAPAGLETTLGNTTGVVDTGKMNDMRQGDLNKRGVNCLRTFPGSGTVVFGARTLETDNPAFLQWRYVPVRRMALFIEQTLFMNLTWVVFEPNDEPLWIAIRTSIERFMLSLFRQGAFQGSSPSQAFQVKCDQSTTTQDDIDNGKVNIIVAFAPLKPAEFVIIKIAQLAGQVQA